MKTHYAIADLHGVYELWRQIKNYCDSSDIIFFLGDAVDRGPDGIKIMKELLLDNRVIYLKGNHEEIFEIIAPELRKGHFSDYNLWLQNGGYNTIEDFLKCSIEEQDWLLKEVITMPESYPYINANRQKIFLSHAGTAYGYKDWNECLLWDRDHIWLDWPKDEVYKDIYLVHGHTPVPWILSQIGQEWNGEILNYADGHKFDIDLGSIDTNRAVLFNLDTLTEEKYFITEKR